MFVLYAIVAVIRGFGLVTGLVYATYVIDSGLFVTAVVLDTDVAGAGHAVRLKSNPIIPAA